MKRTHNCAELDAKNEGQSVTLKGWVDSRRDHGGLIFIDLRDREGITQVVLNPDIDAIAHKTAHEIRSEYVLQITGKVSKRPEGTVNPNLKTGEIEVYADELTVLNDCVTTPFPLHDAESVAEQMRLKYRYLDLRRPEMYKKIAARSKLVRLARSFFDSRAFLDIETPHADEKHAGRSARLSGAQQSKSGKLLRPAAIAATFQTASYGRRFRKILSDRKMFPR